MFEGRAYHLWVLYMNCDVLHALAGNNQLASSPGVDNRDITLTAAAACCGADFTRSNHFHVRDFFKFFHDQSSCLSERGVF